MKFNEIDALNTRELNIAVACALGWQMQSAASVPGLPQWYNVLSPKGQMFTGAESMDLAWEQAPKFVQVPDAVFALIGQIKQRGWDCELDISARHQCRSRVVANPDSYPAEPRDYLAFGETPGEALCKAFLYADKGEMKSDDRP